MTLDETLHWEELTRPGRWAESLRPAMGELESRLPGMLEPNTWLHRNVSVSDLGRIDDPAVSPRAGGSWPLMYLICRFRKALLGIRLVEQGRQDARRVRNFIMEGTPCLCYAVDTQDPAADLDLILEDICREVQKLKKTQRPLWWCRSDLIHMDREGRCLIERGLVSGAAGLWVPTERGEDCGLMTLFAAGRAPQVRWSRPTREALTDDSPGDGPIPLQTRLDRLARGAASSDAYAAEAVLQLAEMPLEEYFRPCPEVGPQDIRGLRRALGLPDACRFRTAAAALFRLRWMEGTAEQSRLMALLAVLAMPVTNMSKNERKTVLRNFRKRVCFR